jgi:hypothetical protein
MGGVNYLAKIDDLKKSVSQLKRLFEIDEYRLICVQFIIHYE